MTLRSAGVRRRRTRRSSTLALAAALALAACSGSEPTDGGPTDDASDTVVATSEADETTTPTSVGAASSTTTLPLITREDDPNDPVNVVVVMTDDQTVEQMRWLPTVVEYMADGVEYANSLTNYPLCGPSRATFLTGQHATNHGLECNQGLAAEFRKTQDNSLGPWLQEADVHTIHVGKYLNGYGGRDGTRYVPDGWDDWRALAGDDAYRYRRFDMVINGEFVQYGGEENAYSTDVLSDHLDEAIRAAPADQSFLAVFTPLAPHYEGGQNFAIPAARHAGLVTDVMRPENFDSCELREDCPVEGSPLANPPLTDEQIAEIDNGYQTASESLFAVDEAFGRMLATLTELSELDNTVIVFTSDNGFFYGEHGVAKGKILPGREALFVPLYVRGPGFDGPAVEEAPVSNIDLAPTIVDVFDATAGREMDGQSLLEPVDEHRALLIQAAKSPAGGYHGVYADGWLFYDHAELERNELYAPDDALQLRTLDDDPEWDATEASLSALTAILTSCVGEACHVSWSVDDVGGADDPASAGPTTDAGTVPGAPSEIVVDGPGPTVTATLTGATARVSWDPVETAQGYRYRTSVDDGSPSDWVRIDLETEFTLTVEDEGTTTVEVSVRRGDQWRRPTAVILDPDATQSDDS